MIRAAKLSQALERQLAAVLADCGKHTSARLALVTVHVSDKYALYPPIYGAVAGIVTLAVLALFAPALSLRLGFCIAVGVTAAAAFALDWMWLRLKLIPRRAKFWECWELAHRSFASRILAQNDRKTGILIFVSLGERYVEVVTDRDVDRHVPQSVWDAVIADFTVAAKAGRGGEGLVAMVDAATKVLAEHYPPAG